MDDIINKQNQKIFKGMIVVVYLINSAEIFSRGIAISEPNIEEFYGRKFLTGNVPQSADDWASGLRTVVAFDQISHFIEFSDENEFIEKTFSEIDGEITNTVQ